MLGTRPTAWTQTAGEMQVNGAGQGDPGGNRVFLTIWDGGGKDTYNLSNYSTDLEVEFAARSLEPSSLASSSQLWETATSLLATLPTLFSIRITLPRSSRTSLAARQRQGNRKRRRQRIYRRSGRRHLTASRVWIRALFWRCFGLPVVQNADGSWTVSDLRAGAPDGTDQLKHIGCLNFSATGLRALQCATAIHQTSRHHRQ